MGFDRMTDLTTQEQALTAAFMAAFPSQSEWAAKTEAAAVLPELIALGWELTEIVSEPLPSEAKARRGDPETSLLAARSIDDLAVRHRAVLDVALASLGSWTYDDLIFRYEGRYERDGMIPKQSPSSIRSRCAELRRAGWIFDTNVVGLSDSGRPAKLWKARRSLADVA